LETLTTPDREFELLMSENWPWLERRDWGDGLDDHGHDGDSILDPHAWLNPQVAMVWTRHIAFAFGSLDPENEVAYLANAGATVVRLVELNQEIEAQMGDLPREGFWFRMMPVSTLGSVTMCRPLERFRSAMRPAPILPRSPNCAIWCAKGAVPARQSPPPWARHLHRDQSTTNKLYVR
jgi:hypothetical protein